MFNLTHFLAVITISLLLNLNFSNVNSNVASKKKLQLVRGIPKSKLKLYQPNKPFRCLDESSQIAWAKVNDDYCDCRDGSDEPGTPACANGVFYCRNRHHKPAYISSSMVRDGICDCCDGSDEDLPQLANCTNTCFEKGRVAREEAARMHDTMTKGHEIYKSYVAQYDTDFAQRRARLDQIEAELQALNAQRAEAERNKTDAEAVETAAKKECEERAARIRQEREKAEQAGRILAAFNKLDRNGDATLSLDELRLETAFDSDHDGSVTEAEALAALNGTNSVTLEEFKSEENIWRSVLDALKAKHDKEVQERKEQKLKEREAAKKMEEEKTGDDELNKKTSGEEKKPDGDNHKEEEEALVGKHLEKDVAADATDKRAKRKSDGGEDVADDKNSDESDDAEDLEKSTNEETKSTASNPETYDAETKKKMETAEAARKAFDEISGKVSNIENEKQKLDRLVKGEFRSHAANKEEAGSDNTQHNSDALHEQDRAFFHLANQDGVCFDNSDNHEYTYRFCPFARTAQISKHDSAETDLGKWKRWLEEGATSAAAGSGGGEAQQRVQLYEGGTGCWNGPNRSTKVVIRCGVENKLVETSEPSRCEYLFKFETPAACAQPPPQLKNSHSDEDDDHDEL